MSNFMGVGIFWISLNRAQSWLLAIDLKMPTCTHTGRFVSVPLCFGQS